jgi:2-methylisocitrate lyase-like PEP mutase family enzyme
MTGTYDLAEGIRRLQAFESAGADCLYLPLPPDTDGLRAVCAAVRGPVNALAAGAFTRLGRADFAALGVARISLGSALARLTHRAILDGARPIFATGDFTALGQGASGAEIDRLLEAGAP